MGMMSILRRWLIGPDKETYFRHRAAYFSSGPLGKKYHSLCCQRILKAYGASIPMGTTIEGRLYLPHGLEGVYISEGAVLGDGCTIFQYTTICSNTAAGSKHPGAPKLGKNVYVGTHCVISGGITIGDNARIGAGCTVAVDVPANATVVAAAPRIFLHDAPRDNAFVGLDEAAEQARTQP